MIDGVPTALKGALEAEFDSRIPDEPEEVRRTVELLDIRLEETSWLIELLEATERAYDDESEAVWNILMEDTPGMLEVKMEDEDS